MILSHFKHWARTASADNRAAGIAALARAYLSSRLGSDRADAERILTEFLDDPSPVVRMALAETLSGSPDAPHHLVLALADDQAEIAAVVLARSPVLTDAELIDCAAVSPPVVQAAIAARGSLTAPVAAAIAEIGAPGALVALASNAAIVLSPATLKRMLERHGSCAELREALLGRRDLPGTVRIEIVAATVRALANLVAERRWISDERMTRIASECRDRAAVTVSAADREGLADLVSHLRRTGRLTTGLALRAVLGNRLALFKAILAELAQVPALRVDAVVRRCEGSAFAGVYRKAGLPIELLPAFRRALAGRHDEADVAMALSRTAIEHVLAGCTDVRNPEIGRLVSLLRRFEAEAARDQARVEAKADLPGQPGSSAMALEPLLLSELAFDDRLPPHHPGVERLVPRRRVPYTIDLAAIEAQLLAA